MFTIQSAEQAVDLIKDKDTIAINSFLSLSNPEALHQALWEKLKKTGHFHNLELFCAAGFGGWDEHLYAAPYIFSCRKTDWNLLKYIRVSI